MVGGEEVKYNVEAKDIDIIDDTDWKLAILIDSCRYDDFKSLCGKTLGYSNPKIASSQCTCTREFMQGHLNREFIDMVYINHTVSVGRWIPNTKFFRLVNVWETHWDYKTWGTIMPWDMADVAIEFLARYQDKRLMVHFVQAHPPYLLPGYEEFNKIEYTPELCMKGQRSQRSFVQSMMRKRLGHERTWKILNTLGIEPIDYFGRVYKKFGMKGLTEGYRRNLELTLIEASRLINFFKIHHPNDKILITSDHSQSYVGKKVDKWEEVPWLEI
jgi:hypothetical protein